MAEERELESRLWHAKPVLTALILLALGMTIAVPDAGVIGAFAIAIIVTLIARKCGSFRDMGLFAPDSWPKLIGTTFVYGFVIQVAFTVVIEPLLARLTGETVDVSVFDGVRGNFGNFLLMMLLGWGVGGLLEEMTFRGFIVGRTRWLLGSSASAAWIGVIAAAVAFGIAHVYQGATGMIATGMIGFVLGAVYICHRFNLWYAIFTHGFINTVGIVAMYLDIDREMSNWLF
jgi:membrane protease YdiL (CAAX protease family)